MEALIKVAVGLLSFYMCTQMSSVSFAQPFDLILSRKLTLDVTYDQAIGAPTKCYCRTSCIVRPECTAVSQFTNELGEIGCLYSEQTQLNFNNSETDITAVTLVKQGSMETPLTEVEKEFTRGYTTASKNTGCELPFIPVDGLSDCVFLSLEFTTGDMAKKICQDLNSQLYVAPSVVEFHALRNHLMRMANPLHVWVGVRANTWFDGRPVDLTEWRQSRLPDKDATVNECARLQPYYDYELDDRPTRKVILSYMSLKGLSCDPVATEV